VLIFDGYLKHVLSRRCDIDEDEVALIAIAQMTRGHPIGIVIAFAISERDKVIPLQLKPLPIIVSANDQISEEMSTVETTIILLFEHGGLDGT